MEHLDNNLSIIGKISNKFLPVKSTVVLSVTIFILAFGLFWFINQFFFKYKNIQNIEINAEIIQKNETIAKLTADVIKKQVASLLAIGSFYANNREVVRLIEKNNWQGAINIMSSILKEGVGSSIDSVFLSDTLGTLKADVPQLKEIRGQNFAYRDWHRGVTTNFRPYVSEIYERAAEPNYNIVALAFPVSNNVGLPIAILVIEIKTDTFLRWLQEVKFGNSGMSFIVDRRGQVIAHPDIPLQGEIVDYSSRADVQKAISGQSGTDFILNSKNERSLSSYEPILEFHWGVITRINLDELINSGLIKDDLLGKIKR